MSPSLAYSSTIEEVKGGATSSGISAIDAVSVRRGQADAVSF